MWCIFEMKLRKIPSNPPVWPPVPATGKTKEICFSLLNLRASQMWEEASYVSHHKQCFWSTELDFQDQCPDFGPTEGRKASRILPMQNNSQEPLRVTMFGKHEGCDKLARGNIFISWPSLTSGASAFSQFINRLELQKVILTFSFTFEIFK